MNYYLDNQTLRIASNGSPNPEIIVEPWHIPIEPQYRTKKSRAHIATQKIYLYIGSLKSIRSLAYNLGRANTLSGLYFYPELPCFGFWSNCFCQRNKVKI